MPCINLVIAPPLNVVPFIKSLLLMIARMLRCTAEALRSAIEIMDGISLDLATAQRSEEHTSELQSQSNLVCRLLLEKKKPISALLAFAPLRPTRMMSLLP